MAITITYTFVPNTTALSAEVNANFSLLASRAVDKTGDTLTGSLFTQLLEPAITNTYDLGTSSLFYRSEYLRTSLVLGQTTANYTLTWANPASARAISFEDPGGTDIVAYKAATQTFTNKTLTSPVINTATISGPTLSGTVLGTYTFGGTPTIPASGLTGTITSATQDLITRTGTLVSGATGAGFTVALTTSTITGTLADARLSANVPLLNATNTFTGTSLILSRATPVLSFRDTATALPGGLWRWVCVSDVFLVQRNTAAGGDYSSATSPLSFSNTDVATFSGSTVLTGDVKVGGTNITDGVGTPTIASGAGAGATIAGKSYGFKVTFGTGAGAGGTVINFGTTYSVAPIVVCSGDATVGAQTLFVPFNISTTQVSLGAYFDNTGPPVAPVNGQIVYVIVRGY